MRNSVLNSEPDQPDEYKDIAIVETLGVGLQTISILDGSSSQINKGFVNLTGRVIGNGNGSIYVSNYNYNIKHHYGNPLPSGAKVLKHDQLEDNAKSSPSEESEPSSSSLFARRNLHDKFLLPSYEQSKEYRSGPKLLKYDQLDNANTNGILASKSSPSSGSSSSLSTTGNKRAVLCGVSYGKGNINGIINHVISMKRLLVKNFKFPVDCIRVLTEEQNDPNLIPTRRNILESLKWLVKDCQSGDSLVFYFSGPSMQPELYGRRKGIYDENICPVDFGTEGMINHNELNSTIVWPLKKGVTLHAILDACQRGTILDLMYVYKERDGIWDWEDNNNKPRGKNPITKQTSGGLVICLSAGEDSQMMSDISDLALFVAGGKSVMTNLFTKTIREHPGITYGGLLEKMHGEIQKIRQRRNNSSFLHIFLKPEKDPLLSSSEEFDVSTRNFTL